MYLRTTSRRNGDGSVVRYLQLAHNEWDSSSGSRTRVLYNFGREDRLDRAAIARLVSSLTRALDPGAALAAGAAAEGLTFLDSRPLGAAYVLDGLWRRLGVDAALRRLLAGRRVDPRAERVLFALTANRACEPASKLAASKWVTERVVIDGLPEVEDDGCYRAMDVLLDVEGELAEAVYWAVADLLNLEVDLLFFDTTSTYFQTERADPPADGNSGGPTGGEAETPATTGFRAYGHSKDHRPDLPQIVIGMAVTRTGIPIRVWCWPGNTADQALIRQVKDDLRDWKLARVVWVADRGFASAENRRYLQRAGGHYIMGEKLRGKSAEAAAALARAGRYHVVAGNLQVKHVVIDDATMRDRFVVCRNPDEADRDRTVRAQVLAQLGDAITGSDQLNLARRAKLAAELKAKPAFRRFLRTTRTGLLRLDRAAVAADTRLDGKFLLRTSDPTLTAEDIALGYKQLLEVERGWRDMKSTLDLRPVYHRKQERIRAHVLLCWLALLLIRLAETACEDTWRNLRHELDRLHQGTFTGPAGTVRQRTEITSGQHRILSALELPEPARFTQLHAQPVAATG